MFEKEFLQSALLFALSSDISVPTLLRKELAEKLISASSDFHEIKTVLTKVSKKSLDAACQEIEKAKAANVNVVNILSEAYPVSLKHCSGAPLLLFIRGTLSEGNRVAIVGTRRPTPYGEAVASKIAETVSKAGISVVSGLAYGIDAISHKASLKGSPFGLFRGVAVLGSGVLSVYPEKHSRLADEMVHAGGAVISEYGLFASPRKHFFPARNRIVSAISKAVIVIEADTKSGSLITASHAAEQGRPVFAVPGRIDQVMSGGPHALIQQGASLLHSVNDLGAVFEELKEQAKVKATEKPEKGSGNLLQTLTDVQKLLFQHVSENQGASIDEICAATGIEVSKINSELSALEMLDLIVTSPGNRYSPRQLMF